MHRHLQTTNAIASVFSNVRQRTDQIDVFTTETSCLAIVWATMQDIRLHPHLAVIQLRAKSGKSSQQPAREGGSGGGGLCSLSGGATAMRGPLFLISLPVLPTPFGSLEAFLCPLRSD